MEMMFVTKKQSARECEEELVKCRDRLVNKSLYVVTST